MAHQCALQRAGLLQMTGGEMANIYIYLSQMAAEASAAGAQQLERGFVFRGMLGLGDRAEGCRTGKGFKVETATSVCSLHCSGTISE
jgi:hypothetical protein